MCGIGGIYRRQDKIVRRQAAQKMSDCIAHRGPDGRGIYEDDDITLVHTRLSIIDLSENGNQPLYNEDKSLVLVCNGEIYNYQSLTQSLLEKGHRFSSHSDCEVILHLYEEYEGKIEKVLSRLTGMFAFALWDLKSKKLSVARDRVGIKPLYYSTANSGFVFSSEISGVLNAGDNSFGVDPTSLYEYFLLGSVPGPNTLFKGIHSLEPGYYITLTGQDVTINKYWEISGETQNWKNVDEVTEATEALLREVIKDHLVADVPVGSFLSAGVDSSLITALAVNEHPGINTFTVSFPGEPEDEGLIATQTAQRLKTTHHSFDIREDFFKGFVFHNRFIDQPFAISSALFLGQISQKAADTVKVVLSGDGGDELFAGYDFRHKADIFPAVFNYVPRFAGNMAAKVLGRQNGWAATWQAYTNSPGTNYLGKVAMHPERNARRLFNTDVLREIDFDRYTKRLDSFFNAWEGDDQINRKLFVDVKTSLVDEMLTKCDRMTMRNGIEGRVPFLDHRMVELSFTIPSSYKRDTQTGKVILRKILEKHLGKELAYRTKTGFNSPLPAWLGKDEATRSFSDKYLTEVQSLPFLDKAAIENVVRNQNQNARTVYALISLSYYLQANNQLIEK
jgi:asparagine synthase (glutamine-hydrolysing)